MRERRERARRRVCVCVREREERDERESVVCAREQDIGLFVLIRELSMCVLCDFFFFLSLYVFLFFLSSLVFLFFFFEEERGCCVVREREEGVCVCVFFPLGAQKQQHRYIL